MTLFPRKNWRSRTRKFWFKGRPKTGEFPDFFLNNKTEDKQNRVYDLIEPRLKHGKKTPCKKRNWNQVQLGQESYCYQEKKVSMPLVNPNNVFPLEQTEIWKLESLWLLGMDLRKSILQKPTISLTFNSPFLTSVNVSSENFRKLSPRLENQQSI